jgi:hypothetical protein
MMPIRAAGSAVWLAWAVRISVPTKPNYLTRPFEPNFKAILIAAFSNFSELASSGLHESKNIKRLFAFSRHLDCG